MELDSDFLKKALVHSQDEHLQPSPIPGIDRRMLDRIGYKVARATKIVRYALGSKLSAHIHIRRKLSRHTDILTFRLAGAEGSGNGGCRGAGSCSIGAAIHADDR
ncbi:MAG: cupin domain-containing protein [Paracoccaceae bacterium]